MSLKKNTRIIGQHAFLSPSNYHWLDYDEEKLRRVYFEKQQASRGDKMHAYAQQAIELGIVQADNNTTMSMYINDAIGFRMEAEVPLYYTENCFGTADSAGIRNERGKYVLRISDLKTGIIPASMKQLLIYAGIFFFEYEDLFDPRDVSVVLKIYQNDAIDEFLPESSDIILTMSKIKAAAKMIAYWKAED